MSDLKSAYSLETPQDSITLYANWAESYDESFAQAMDYRMPAIVAKRFAMLGGVGPALDVGAGTGLVAEAMQDVVLDGLDISDEMLQVAAAKGLYRNRLQADLTKPLPIRDDSYSGVISAGTFTHGHVGPNALDELMRVAAPDALFVLGVNAEHFQARGFADKFAGLSAAIRSYEQHDVPIYGPGADDAHRDDKVRVVSFRKAVQPDL